MPRIQGNLLMNDLLARRLPDFVLLIYILAVTIGAFTGGLWASLGLGSALCLFVLVWYINRKPPAPEKSLIVIALAVLLVAACLNLNSSNPGLSWHEWIKLATIFLPLCFLLSPAIASRATHPKFFTVLPLAMIVGGWALGLELYFDGPLLRIFRGFGASLEGYNRGLSYLVLIAFPVMAALWSSEKRWTIVPFFILLLVLTGLGESRATKLALILALPVVVLAHVWPVFMRRVLMTTPFVAIGWPFAARWFFLTHYDLLARIPDSFRARIEIWDYISYRIMERPLFGWGLGTSYTLPFSDPHGALYVFTIMPAGHPHNVVAQLWVELGLPGLVLGIAFALLMLRKASRLDPRLAPFAMGFWVAGFCLCLIAYNFWTDSLFAAFALTGVAFTMLEQKLKLSRSSGDVQEVH